MKILGTIKACANLQPIRGIATVPLSAAHVSAETDPFTKLDADIARFFDGELDSALAGPERADAEREISRIIGEHVAAARVRLAIPAPAFDWMSTDSLYAMSSAAIRRAADLRFIAILTTAA